MLMGNMYTLDKGLARCSLVIFIVIVSRNNVVQGELAIYVWHARSYI